MNEPSQQYFEVDGSKYVLQMCSDSQPSRPQTEPIHQTRVSVRKAAAQQDTPNLLASVG